LTAVAQAVPTVTAGNHLLAPNTPGQVIPILVSSANENVAGLDLYLYLNGNSGLGPIITAVDVIGPGTIFNPNNVGQFSLGPPYDVPGQQPSAITTTASGFVVANGTLAFVTVDTTGVAGGVFPLGLFNPDLGPTDFAVNPGFDAILVDGSITVVPEPASIVMGLFAAAGIGAVVIRRRRAKAAA
jgi:hypothetical protein